MKRLIRHLELPFVALLFLAGLAFLLKTCYASNHEPLALCRFRAAAASAEAFLPPPRGCIILSAAPRRSDDLCRCASRNGRIGHLRRGSVLIVQRVILLTILSFLAAPGLGAQAGPSAEQHLKNAIRHIQSREVDAALDASNKAIELNPRYAAAFLLRGHVRENKGDVDGALSDYTRAIDLAPTANGIEVGYNNRSILLLRKGDTDGALGDINNAIKLNPRIAAFYNQRAIILLQKGKSESAVADYEKALALDPKFASAYFGRGGYRFRTGDMEGAAADYDKAIESTPSYSNAYVYRGIARGIRGDLGGAVRDIKKGASLDRNVVSDQSQGNFTSPFKDLSQFITSNPDNARGYAVRGILRLIQDKTPEAEQDFRKSIEIDPLLKSEIDKIREITQTP